jgi:hypothetical protein
VPAETVESWIQDQACQVSRTFAQEAARRERRWIVEAMRDPKQARFVEFMLRCTNRDDYDERKRLEVSGPDGGPIRTEGQLTHLTNEDLFAVLGGPADDNDGGGGSSGA